VKLRKGLSALLVALLVLVVLRAAAPVAGRALINWVLAEKLEKYTGRIADLDLQFLRGGVAIHDLVLRKRNSDLPPLVSVRTAAARLDWGELLRGRLRAHIFADHLVYRATDSRKEEMTQTGTEEKDLGPKARRAMPVTIESLVVKDSELRFENLDFKEPLALKISDLQVSAKNLRNRRGLKRGELSPLSIKAKVQDHAPLAVNGRLDMISRPPRFDLDLKLESFNLPSVNKLLLAYVPVDLSKGRLSLYAEAASAGGKTRGYVKAFLQEGDVISPKEKIVSPKNLVIEIVGGFANWLLENNTNKNLAARIPFAYEDGELDVNGSAAFWSTIKNNWDKMPRGIEHSVP
jgi:hypothetical protein